MIWWLGVIGAVLYVWMERDLLSALGVCFIVYIVHYLPSMPDYDCEGRNWSWILGLEEYWQYSHKQGRVKAIQSWRQEDQVMTRVMIRNAKFEWETFGETSLPDSSMMDVTRVRRKSL